MATNFKPNEITNHSTILKLIIFTVTGRETNRTAIRLSFCLNNLIIHPNDYQSIPVIRQIGKRVFWPVERWDVILNKIVDTLYLSYTTKGAKLMMLFAETPELVAYKEVVDGMITVIFESIHSETFSISAEVRSDIDVADALFLTGWQQYVENVQVS